MNPQDIDAIIKEATMQGYKQAQKEFIEWLSDCHYNYCEDDNCSNMGIYNRMCSAINDKIDELKQFLEEKKQ